MRAIVFIVVVAALLTFLWAAWKVRQELRGEVPDPLVTLRQELAEGKITTDEFLERESALRSSAPRQQRGWKW